MNASERITDGADLLSRHPLLLAVTLAPVIAWLNPLFTAMLTKSIEMTAWATGLSMSVTLLAIFMSLIIFLKRKEKSIRAIACLGMLANLAFVLKAVL